MEVKSRRNKQNDTIGEGGGNVRGIGLMFTVLKLLSTICTELLTRQEQLPGGFTCLMSLYPHNTLRYQFPHFRDEETGVQTGQTICTVAQLVSSAAGN